jgi:WD40 repeat protein
MPESRLEDLVRGSLHANVDSESFAGAPHLAATRARRRVARNGLTVGIVTLVVFFVGLGAVRSFLRADGLRPVPADSPSSSAATFVTGFAYSGYVGGEIDAVTTDLTGSSPRPIASGWPLAESPDGTAILAYQGDTNGLASLVIVRADGTTTAVAETRTLAGADFSPDGRQVVYASNTQQLQHGPNDGLWMVNADGSGARLLVAPDVPHAHLLMPTWSADGSRIAYVRLEGSTSQMFMIDADGSNAARIDAIRNLSWPTWSPNGDRIAFQRETAHSRDIFVTDPDGANVLRVSGDFEVLSPPTWSLDGGRLAFLTPAVASEAVDALIVNADGSDPTRARLPGDVAKDSPLVWIGG